MASTDSPRERVLSSVASSVAMPNAADISVPEHLRGRLWRAHGTLPQEPPKLDGSEPFAISNVTVRNKYPWQGVRTSPELVNILTADVQRARTIGEFHEAARALPRSFMSTGVYKDVSVATEPAANHGKGTDLVLELDESRFNVSTGMQQTSRGQLLATLEASLSNPFGTGEKFTASYGGSSGEFNFAAASDFLSNPAAGFNGTDRATVARTHGVLSPTLNLTFTKPTFYGWRTPVAVSLRNGTERTEATLGFSNKTAEVETSISDASNRHSLSHILSFRNLIPIPHPSSDFLTASSPLVVSNCDASVKSSLAYSYAFSTPGRSANQGSRVAVNLEVAGLGGEAQFGRAQLHLHHAFSLFRHHPDTGYRLPSDRAAHLLEAAPPPPLHAHAGRPVDDGLQPHPGPAILWGGSAEATAADAMSTSPAPPRPFSLLHQLAGWLSPGVTVALDGGLGVLLPLGRDVERPNGSRLADRFFLSSARLRGFDAVGPLATRVQYGSTHGDAVGGDVVAHATARLLLPPPFPSVRMANAGLRTHLYATAGRVGAYEQLVRPSDFVAGLSASAGIGLTMPLTQDISLEGNYSLWHSAQPGDVTASLRLSLMA